MDYKYAISNIPTSMGDYEAVFTQRGLGLLLFPTQPASQCDVWLKKRIPDGVKTEFPEMTRLLTTELNEYFDGKLQNFSVPLDLRGTPFQMKVWQALLSIPYGQTRSYKLIADQIQNPLAVRAVGMANHRNPVPIIVPCHRVIGKNGGLVGYGGGLDLKHRLLSIEGVLL